MAKYTIGLDFGTNSCRSLIVDVTDGTELAGHVFDYPSGENGVILDPADPNLARQNPQDYLTGIEVIITEALSAAEKDHPAFHRSAVIGIGVDTTGSSPMPVDRSGRPMCFLEKYRNNPDAMVWLWKDHTSYEEAALITKRASELRPEYLNKVGGTYSSEWFWSKILHCRNVSPQLYEEMYSFVEICDFIVAHLTGDLSPDRMKRSVCAAGHKALYNEDWGGLPDAEFLDRVSPGLGGLRARLYEHADSSDKPAGFLSEKWAKRLGLNSDVAIATGGFDAHMGAVGAGIGPGTLVKIMGTSTCDVMVWPNHKPLEDIPGVCGIANGSVKGGFFGIEAGQSAVGDIFLWFVNHLVPERFGKTAEEKFRILGEEAARLKPGESGLLALDWNNGNRTILVDVRLTGLLIGQTLHTTAPEIYRAFMEATAFGALTIIDRIEEFHVGIEEVVNCGGLAVKNPLLMQIYADVMNRPMKISRSEQTPALGAAVFGAVAAGKARGGWNSVEDAQEAMTATSETYLPDPENKETYEKLYRLYRQLHDSFGTRKSAGNMFSLMKELLDIRDGVRTAAHA